jgi:hypothetical protein
MGTSTGERSFSRTPRDRDLCNCTDILQRPHAIVSMRYFQAAPFGYSCSSSEARFISILYPGSFGGM